MRLLARNLIGIALAVLLAIAVPFELHAATGVTILAHDVVNDAAVSTASKANAVPNVAPERERTVSFTAFGSHYVLDLQPNDRLVAGVLAELHHTGNVPGIYQGTIASRPETWTRIAIDDDGKLSGVVWDGAELLILDQASRLRDYLQTPAALNETLAVRGSDIRITIADEIGLSLSQGTTGIDKLFAGFGAPSSVASVSRAVSLGLVLDNAYVGNAPDKTVQRAIELANIADGIFVSQIAVHLNVEHIRAYDADSPDPFTTSNPVKLLDQLVVVKKNDAALSEMGIVHMFTRVDLDGDTRGIAKLGSFCSANKGAGLTEGYGSTIDALIMAHEIGHNFGARHDGVSGEGCGSTAETFLMAPDISGSSQFSQCSVDKMMQTLNSASCLTNVPTSEVTISSPVLPETVLYGERVPFEYVVTNVGTESAVDASLIVSTQDRVELRGNGSPDRSCGYAGPQPSHRCDLLSLYPGESVTVRYSLEARQVGQVQFDATVNASNDINESNNSAVSSIEVLKATDLTPYGKVAIFSSGNIKAGEVIRYSASAINLGDFDSLSQLRISTTPNHSLSTNDGCSALNHFTLNCDLGSLPAGADRSVGFMLHSDPTMIIDPADEQAGSVQLYATSSVPDVVPINNSFKLHFQMWGTLRNIYSAFVDPPVSIDQGETRQISGVFGNHGPDFVRDVSATVRARSPGIRIDNVVVAQGSCTRRTDEQMDCQIGDLAAGQTVAVEATYTGNEPGTYTIEIGTSVDYGLDENDGDNYEAVAITVLASPLPPAPSAEKKQASGGGGLGLISSLVLLLLFGRLYDGGVVQRELVHHHVGSRSRRKHT